MSLLIREKAKTLEADIKNELDVFFPKTDFLVTSSHQSEEDRTTITVSYTDGPVRTRVRSVIRGFAHTFHAERKPVQVTIEVKRSMSKEMGKLLLTEMKSVWKVKENLTMDDFFKPLNGKVSDYINKIFIIRDF